MNEAWSQKFDENFNFIDSVVLLKNLTQMQKESLSQSLIIKKFNEGEKIYHEGDESQSLFIIKEGRVICKEEKEERKLIKGDYFGESSLLYKQKRTGDVVVSSQGAVCAILYTDVLQELLGSQLQRILYSNAMKLALNSTELFKKLTS